VVFVRVVTLSLLLLGGVLGCGGQTAHGGPADASADATAGSDASTGRDAGADVVSTDVLSIDAGDSSTCGSSCDAGPPATACPAAPPAAGGPCVAPLTCEYGGSWFLECNVVFRCQPSGGGAPGRWLEEYDGGACTWLDAGGQCPATWDEARAVDAGPGSCPFVSCVYPEGFCGCGVMCGGGGGVPRPRDVTGTFACIPTQPGCPEPRPLSGGACVGSASCNYGFACGCGQIEQCTGGQWLAEPGPPCP
jgi:hypothetical protein